MGSGSGRGLGWGGCATQVPRRCWLSRNERPPARNGRRMRGSGRGAGRRKLTGASMTLRPTCPRDPCSRSRGPTTWRPKASMALEAARPSTGGSGGAPSALPAGRAGGRRASAQSCQRSPRLSIHTRRERPSNGHVTMLPAGEWWRPRDARRPRPASGRLPSYDRGREVAAWNEGCSLKRSAGSMSNWLLV